MWRGGNKRINLGWTLAGWAQTVWKIIHPWSAWLSTRLAEGPFLWTVSGHALVRHFRSSDFTTSWENAISKAEPFRLAPLRIPFSFLALLFRSSAYKPHLLRLPPAQGSSTLTARRKSDLFLSSQPNSWLQAFFSGFVCLSLLKSVTTI